MARPKQFWRYVRGLAAPALLWGLFVAVLIEPLQSWLEGEERHNVSTIREWIEEARPYRETLPSMARDYLDDLRQARAEALASGATLTDSGEDIEKYLEILQVTCEKKRGFQLPIKRARLEEQLRALGTPPKMYSGQLPGFPVVYRLELSFDVAPGLPPLIVFWDSKLPRHTNQYRELDYDIENQAHLKVQYQLRAYNKYQRAEQFRTQRFRWMGLLAIAGTLVSLLWIALVQQRERERERQRSLAQQQLDQAEHRRLEEELRRRQAEQHREEAERKLLEQRLATQAAEGRTLELKSQLYASIGIMAGSYAHNIKNLLVRPNDLLRRCLEADGLSTDQEYMLREVRQTLGTVTERLQQILRTVRRDPNRSELTRLDLNEVVCDLQRTWEDLAREKWKLALKVDLDAEPLAIEADLSHLQQAVENLLFNARDATFEMRNHLRDVARLREGLTAEERRQALIAAAAWKGRIVLRTRRQGDQAVLEVQDNGIGMTDEVRQCCTQTHFSTKRDNAIYEGNSTGMGLGLSFVVVILEHHQATLEIASEPLQGATFRVRFPLATVPQPA
jgi:signal transduction histidine kinase